MEELQYRFTNDTVFKMFFVKNPKLLKRLVAQILGIPMESIWQFIITNPEMPPETLGDKFCRLDINMLVDGQRVDIEVRLRKKQSDWGILEEAKEVRAKNGLCTRGRSRTAGAHADVFR